MTQDDIDETDIDTSSNPEEDNEFIDDDEDESVEDATKYVSTSGSEYSRWQSKRPHVHHLKEGIIFVGEHGELPLFNINDRVVVEIMTNVISGNPWLETIVAKVASINDTTGVIVVIDEDTGIKRYVAFKGKHKHLYNFKLAPVRGNPFVIRQKKDKKDRIVIKVSA
jgi:hypothetical protein